jgi:hypothetical protein
MEVRGQHHALAPFTSVKKNRGTHCTRGGVSPRTGLDEYGKQKISRHPPWFERWTLQPVASRRYTDLSVQAPSYAVQR